MTAPIDAAKALKKTRYILTSNLSQITLNGLNSGRYRLEESKAPAGYVITDPYVYFTIAADEAGELRIMLTDESGTGESSCTNALVDNQSKTIIIKNNPGVTLPATGGSGTDLLYLLGSMLILISGTGIIFRNRRKRAG